MSHARFIPYMSAKIVSTPAYIPYANDDTTGSTMNSPMAPMSTALTLPLSRLANEASGELRRIASRAASSRRTESACAASTFRASYTAASSSSSGTTAFSASSISAASPAGPVRDSLLGGATTLSTRYTARITGAIAARLIATYVHVTATIW
ncbi:MAG: hypothetical protein ABIP93_06150 [Gemmatimonadaceae bacterium]